jgi:hypothetical protein
MDDPYYEVRSEIEAHEKLLKSHPDCQRMWDVWVAHPDKTKSALNPREMAEVWGVSELRRHPLFVRYIAGKMGAV